MKRVALSLLENIKIIELDTIIDQEKDYCVSDSASNSVAQNRRVI